MNWSKGQVPDLVFKKYKVETNVMSDFRVYIIDEKCYAYNNI